jgi:hypothetical protein
MEDPQEAQPRGPNRHVLAAVLASAGALGLLSFVLGWARLSYPVAPAGMANDPVGHGKAGLLLGLFSLVASSVVFVVRSPSTARAWGTIGAICATGIGVFAVVDLLTERARAIEGLVAATVRAGTDPKAVNALIGNGVVAFSFRAGIYLAVASGVLGLAALSLLAAGLSRDSSRTVNPGA